MHLFWKVVLSMFLTSFHGTRCSLTIHLRPAPWNAFFFLFHWGQPQKGAAIEAIAFPSRPPRLSGARWRAGLFRIAVCVTGHGFEVHCKSQSDTSIMGGYAFGVTVLKKISLFWPMQSASYQLNNYRFGNGVRYWALEISRFSFGH